MKRLILSFMFLAGCASSSGVVEIGTDSYMISSSGSIGKMGVGNMKIDSIREANEYCKERGKVMQLTASQESPATVGNVARTEIQFMCLKEGDQRRAVMTPVSPAPADKLLQK